MEKKYNRIFIPSQMFRLSDNDGTGRKYDLLGHSLYDQEYNFITHDIHRVTDFNDFEYVREISKSFKNDTYVLKVIQESAKEYFKDLFR